MLGRRFVLWRQAKAGDIIQRPGEICGDAGVFITCQDRVLDIPDYLFFERDWIDSKGGERKDGERKQWIGQEG